MSRKTGKSGPKDKPVATYCERDIVLGKVRGFPPWPGMVVDPDSVPPAVQQERPAKKSNFYCVQFFPAGDYAWLVPKDISRLQHLEIESYINEPYKKSGELLAGYRTALDPTAWVAQRAAALAAAADDDDEDDDADDDDDDDDDDDAPADKDGEVDELAEEGDDAAAATKRRAAAAARGTKRKRDPEPRTRKGPKDRERDRDLKSNPKPKPAKTPKPKQQRQRKGKSAAMVESEDERDRRADPDDDAEPDPDHDHDHVPNHKKPPSPPPAKKPRRDDDPDESPTQGDTEAIKVRDWRHKLQKAFLSAKSTPDDSDMPGLDNLFSIVEAYDTMTVAYLQFSKIGKVMRHITLLDDKRVPRDHEFRFRARAQALVERWQSVLGAAKDPRGGKGRDDGRKDPEPDPEGADNALGAGAPLNGVKDNGGDEGGLPVGVVNGAQVDVDMNAPTDADAPGEADGEGDVSGQADAPGEAEDSVMAEAEA